jgi:hypothetical protein
MAIKTRSNRTTPIVASKIAPIILITTPLPRTEPILYPCRRVFKCKACHRQFSATSGNLLACRKLPFRTLFTGIPQIAADFRLILFLTSVNHRSTLWTGVGGGNFVKCIIPKKNSTREPERVGAFRSASALVSSGKEPSGTHGVARVSRTGSTNSIMR